MSVDPSEIMRASDAALKAALLKYSKLLPPGLIEMGKMVLGAPGKVMYWSALAETGTSSPPAKWPLLVVLSYRAALPLEMRYTWRNALPAVVAVELAAAAADLIDEAADEDPSPIIEKYGAGQALNTANLMLVMAQQVLLWETSSGNERALLALGALQDMLVEAAVGQHLDMTYERMGLREVTPDMSGDMTNKKAGALMSGALRMGALMAGADEKVVDLLADIGRQLGGIAQLTNDIQDVLPQQATLMDEAGEEVADRLQAKTDLRQRKRTLPIVFALREKSDEPNALQLAFSKPATEDEDEEAMRRAVVEAGGLNFAYLVMDVYSNNAAERLAELEKLRPGAEQELAPLL